MANRQHVVYNKRPRNDQYIPKGRVNSNRVKVFEELAANGGTDFKSNNPLLNAKFKAGGIFLCSTLV